MSVLDSFVAHCRGRYPREFAYATDKGVRRVKAPVKSAEELRWALKNLQSNRGLYVSVYSYSAVKEDGSVDYSSAVINRIFLDFDCKEDAALALVEAREVVDALGDYGIRALPFFTGGKGFALYIDFEPVLVAPENKKAVLGVFWDSIQKNLCGRELVTLDRQIRGDVARVSRLPNSLHKSGLYCVPLDIWELCTLEFFDIKDLARSPRLDFDLERVIGWHVEDNSRVMRRVLEGLERRAVKERCLEEELRVARESRLAAAGKNGGEISEDMVEAAREFPIRDLLGSSDRLIICPLHRDSNPSLSVDHERGLWHCFGCGKGGDVISLYMELHGVGFVDAVRALSGGMV
jgi:hypothetical protein